jgi:type IV pilus assembly protein PilA
MRHLARRTRAAFTLIELMIVVAIVGILAMLAAYGVRKYIASSKTTEARNALGRMANAVVIAYEDDEYGQSGMLTPGTSSGYTRAMCNKASGPVPPALTTVAGRKYQSTFADWNVDSVGNSGFACLKFTIDQPQYYQYMYTTSGTTQPGDTFTSIANGDLNGDGVYSTFSLTGQINSSFVINVAPNMAEINPEE